jgi:centrin-2/centrin-1
MIVPEVALETIFKNFGTKDGEYLDSNQFVNGLAGVESDKSGAPTASKNWDNNGITFDGKCAIKDELLKEYDENMVLAVRKAFDLFDGDGSNTIECIDLDRVLCALNQDFSVDDLINLLNSIDPENTGIMQYKDFMDHVVKFIQGKYSQIHKLSIHRIQDSFKKFDMNGDGTISHAELRYILTTTNKHLNLTNEDCDALIEVLDIDKNGFVEWIEFVSLFELVKDDVKMLDLPLVSRRALRKVNKYIYIFIY